MGSKKARRLFLKAENLLASLILILVAVIPALEVAARKLFNTGIRGSAEYTVHLILWVTFLGGAITARERRHLNLSAGFSLTRQGPLEKPVRIINSFISVALTTLMTWTSFSLALIGYDPTNRIGVVPIRLVVLIMPVGFALMAWRFFRAAPLEKGGRWISGLGFLAGTLLSAASIANILASFFPDLPPVFFELGERISEWGRAISWPAILLIAFSALLGTPLFVVLGGIAYFLFFHSGGTLEAIPNEAYTMLTGASIPAIPLFTLAGFILSESRAGERLVKLFQAFFGWLPGGLAIMAILVCTFFTTFTGASGVTILALGGLLSYILVNSGKYKPNFSNGLLTASGSIGLLFPPSLPIILYGVVAQINIKHLFVGGFLPGLLMVLTLSILGVHAGVRHRAEKVRFLPGEALAAFRESILEILLPVVILLGFFLGITTLVETGAIAVIYALVVEVFIKRDIPLRKLPRVIMKCLPIIGGVLVILALAKGLSYYIVDAEVPMHLSAWTRLNIQSPYLFLLLLNLALLATGCLMDIYSAILVVAPLVIPLGEVYGVHPVHLGIIFLANLELGYLTPPVGMNLFLASYRFNQPLGVIYRNVVPFFLALLVTVLLITYVPWVSTGLLGLINL